MALAVSRATGDLPMRTAVEISLYPLDADYVPPIKDFIERLHRHPELSVVTNSMSTQVAGPHDAVFAALAQETRVTFGADRRAVFVMKVLGGPPTSGEG
jgi:uncharacterized protein YqgV (UPF0045/DUF77 family)